MRASPLRPPGATAATGERDQAPATEVAAHPGGEWQPHVRSPGTHLFAAGAEGSLGTAPSTGHWRSHASQRSYIMSFSGELVKSNDPEKLWRCPMSCSLGSTTLGATRRRLRLQGRPPLLAGRESHSVPPPAFTSPWVCFLVLARKVPHPGTLSTPGTPGQLLTDTTAAQGQDQVPPDVT